jgi:hypothetical protein
MIPSWLNKALGVPIVKWLIGAVALLLVIVWVALKRMWLLQQRLIVTQQIRNVENSYNRERAKLRSDQLSKLNALALKRERRHIELERSRRVIRKAQNEGVDAVAGIVNKAFKGK